MAAGTSAFLALLSPLWMFTVDTSESALVTDFGRPVQVITRPGLFFKLPYQSVRKFDNRIFVDSPAAGEYLTREKTLVVAGGDIVWKIADPRKFFETVFDVAGARSRLSDIVSAELGAAIGREPLAAFVSEAQGLYRAEPILAQVTSTCRELALHNYGIELVDFSLKSFEFPVQNRPRLYARMKSERARLSMQYRSEGEEAGLKLRADADSERGRILAEATQVAQQHRGEGEAAAARIYAEALSQAPEFYRFLRGLEASRRLVSKTATLVMSADSELFGLLRRSDYFEQNTSAAAVATPP